MPRDRRVDLGPHSRFPVRVQGQVDLDPGGVDAAVDLPCEEGADLELWGGEDE